MLLWPPYGIGQAIIFLPCGFFFFYLFSAPNLSRRRLHVCHTSTHGANLRCRSETCCTRFAKKYRKQKIAKNRHLSTIAQLCRAIIFAIKARIDNRKNSLSSNISSTCPHNMVSFGPLAAEIGPVVCGTPGIFDEFRVLAALLHGTPVLGVSQTLRRSTYSAGRPSG